EHGRQVEHERQHVVLVVERAGGQVALIDRLLERESVDVLGQVLEEALLHPVGYVDDVGREQVRQTVGAGRCAHLGDVVVVRHDGEVDLVLVALVVCGHQELGLLLERGAGPEGEGAAVVGSVGTGGGSAVRGRTGTAGGHAGEKQAGGDQPSQQGQGAPAATDVTHGALLVLFV